MPVNHLLDENITASIISGLHQCPQEKKANKKQNKETLGDLLSESGDTVMYF